MFARRYKLILKESASEVYYNEEYYMVQTANNFKTLKQYNVI
jgi:hypothetical protein